MRLTVYFRANPYISRIARRKHLYMYTQTHRVSMGSLCYDYKRDLILLCNCHVPHTFFPFYHISVERYDFSFPFVFNLIEHGR